MRILFGILILLSASIDISAAETTSSPSPVATLASCNAQGSGGPQDPFQIGPVRIGEDMQNVQQTLGPGTLSPQCSNCTPGLSYFSGPNEVQFGVTNAENNLTRDGPHKVWSVTFSNLRFDAKTSINPSVAPMETWKWCGMLPLEVQPDSLWDAEKDVLIPFATYYQLRGTPKGLDVLLSIGEHGPNTRIFGVTASYIYRSQFAGSASPK